MELLFKREQSTTQMSRVNFKLWGKLEVTEDEQALINRYRLDEAILIGADDRHLLRGAIKLGAVVFVIDMLHGRNFTCDSVIELAKKEAWLEGACALFRQVMESAKHWDGVERHTIEPLPKEQAKELILRAY